MSVPSYHLDFGEQVDVLKEAVGLGPVCLVGLPRSGKYTLLKEVVGSHELREINLGGSKDQIERFATETDKPCSFLLRNVHALSTREDQDTFLRALNDRKRHERQILALTSRWPLEYLVEFWGFDDEQAEGVNTYYLQPVPEVAIKRVLNGNVMLANEVYNRTGGLLPIVRPFCDWILKGVTTCKDAEDHAREELCQWYGYLRKTFSRFRLGKAMPSFEEVFRQREISEASKNILPFYLSYFASLGLGTKRIPDEMGVLRDLVIEQADDAPWACGNVGLLGVGVADKTGRSSGGESKLNEGEVGCVCGGILKLERSGIGENKKQILVLVSGDEEKKAYKITNQKQWDYIDRLLKASNNLEAEKRWCPCDSTVSGMFKGGNSSKGEYSHKCLSKGAKDFWVDCVEVEKIDKKIIKARIRQSTIL